MLLWLGLSTTASGFAQPDTSANRQNISDEPLKNWGSWRGPLATGEAPQSQPPREWDESTNVKWKVPIPGRGHSTPIVWNDHIFLTYAIPFGEKLEPRYSGAPGAHDNLPISQHHRFAVVALDRRDGSVRWTKVLHEALPHEGAHRSASLASASPVTDGQRLYVHFGSYGLYCLDYEGNVLWDKDLGTMNTKHGHGEGISPVLHNGRLVINWDHEGQSFIACFDSRDGSEIWKKNRDEVTSWSTPIVVEHRGQQQIIVPGTDRLRSYDLRNGEIIWECGGLSANIVASPVAFDGMVFAGSSYEKRAILAVRLEGARGNITDTDQVIWKRTDLTPYVPSPLMFDGAIYYLRHYQGVLSRIDAKTGNESPGAFRLRGVGNIYASPVAAGDCIYVTSLEGKTCVISGGEVPRILGVNELDDSFSASAAIAGNEIFLRGDQHLYCIGHQ